jgi:putative heme iron utilization protein
MSADSSSHVERARSLAQTVRVGSLATLAQEPAGFPYASFVTFALDGAAPVFLLSELAEHTRNLRADDRAALLIVEEGEGEPLALARLTLIGRCRAVTSGSTLSESAKRAMLARHPSAERYLLLKDFSFWRLEVETLRYVGGFGRMSWGAGAEWTAACGDL